MTHTHRHFSIRAFNFTTNVKTKDTRHCSNYSSLEVYITLCKKCYASTAINRIHSLVVFSLGTSCAGLNTVALLHMYKQEVNDIITECSDYR